MSTTFIDQYNDQTRARLEHLDKIRELVGNVYPSKFVRSRVVNSEREDTITAIVERFTPLVPQQVEGARPAPEELERANAELNHIDVRLSGRLAVPPRVMGKAAFVHLSDGNERLQIYVRRDDVKEMPLADRRLIDGWQLFGLLDHGDFIGVEGFLFVTRTGELSVHVRRFEFLSKALLPMPDKLHGISDPEIRQRQRYADLIASSLKIDTHTDEQTEDQTPTLNTRQVFERRSKIITHLRRYLDDHDFIEVETPILSPLASGAAAKPFETYHNALGIKLYARIAPELYLKRLLVGGFERVYELNRNFRNEGISYKHNPEFTMLEFYCAYMDVNGMMDFCEEMIRTTVEKVTNSNQILFDRELRYIAGKKRGRHMQHKINFSHFDRLSMKGAIRKYLLKNPNFEELEIGGREIQLSWFDDPKKLRALANFFRQQETYEETAKAEIQDELELSEEEVEDKHGDLVLLRMEQFINAKYAEQQAEPTEEETARHILFLFETLVEPKLIQPTFIYDYPKPISPLSKASPTNPTIAERFELFIAGMECANGFSELNDPFEQEQRFDEQVAQRERGDEEAMQKDVDYLHALAYGMPPAAGIGIGVDRLVMLLTNRRSIRDVILFPHMRPQRQAEEASKEEDEAQGE
ncbi:MAG TPA: lysine--tRNA ligase [Pyrinomonadaceae bacterium]|jgi:lysyl-tRNA synthetase class 2